MVNAFRFDLSPIDLIACSDVEVVSVRTTKGDVRDWGGLRTLKDKMNTSGGIGDLQSHFGADIKHAGTVNGHAIGLGASIALLCDTIFMAEGATIADPHVSVGIAGLQDEGFREAIGCLRGASLLQSQSTQSPMDGCEPRLEREPACRARPAQAPGLWTVTPLRVVVDAPSPT